MRERIKRGPVSKNTAEKTNEEFSNENNEKLSQNTESTFSDRPRREYGNRTERPFSDRPRRPYGERSGDSSERPRRSFGENSDRPRGDRPYSDRPRRPYGERSGDSSERPRRSFGEGSDRPRGDRPFGDRPRGDRPYGDKPRGDRPFSDRPRRPYGERSGDSSERPRRSFGEGSDRPRGDRPFSDRPRGDRPYGDKPRGDRPFSDRPRRPYGERSGDSSERPRRSFGEGSDRPRGDRPYSDRPRKTYSDKPERRSDYNKEAPAPRIKGEKPVAKQEKKKDQIRLNKYIANSGICSRREADTFIAAGVVSVNGVVITELGTIVNRNDDIRFNGERLKGEKRVYIIMNKPKNFVTTTSDSNAEKTVMDLISPELCPERVFPVGRLDKNTTGVLLFTNDGELAEQLTHPSYQRKKVYQVTLDKNLTQPDMVKLTTGIELEDGLASADAVAYVGEKKDTVGIEIHSGKNRIVRRMFEELGYRVDKLDRVFFAGLSKKNIRRGQWRFLTEEEVSFLKMGSHE